MSTASPTLFLLVCSWLLVATSASYESNTKPNRQLERNASTLFLPFIPFESNTSLDEMGDIDAVGLPDGIPSWGSPIALSPDDDSVWTVNPDSGTVTIVATQVLTEQVEIAVGSTPWSLAVAPSGNRAYVLDRAEGKIVVLDAQTHAIHREAFVGPELGSVALSPTGAYAYLTVTGADLVAVWDTRHHQAVGQISVDRSPYGIAVTDDGDDEDLDETILVTHLFAQSRPSGEEARDDGREGRITIIDSQSLTVTNVISMAPNGEGFPNLLNAVSISANQAWIPHVRTAPDLPNGLTSTVFAAISSLDLTNYSEETSTYLALNDQEIFGSPVNNPVAVVPSSDGNRLYVVLAGSDLVEVIDIADPAAPSLLKFMAVERNPRGMAISPDGSRGYVLNYLSRSISVLDLVEMEPLTSISVTTESLTPNVLNGKILFNNAVNPKLSQGSWVSCASCHPDGGTDSVTWIFPDGPRQTPPIWNAGETLPWHWSAALDEPQDVEETIHLIQHGLGLAPGTDPNQLGEPNAGRSEELDALAAFMTQGVRVPNLATQEESAGRALFQSAGCSDCHGGAYWTASTLSGPPGSLDADGDGMINETLRDVGTLNPRDIRGHTGFDPPSLLNVGITAPYLHDGSALTLDALLRSGHPTPDAGNGLNDTEIVELVQFLLSITTETPPITDP